MGLGQLPSRKSRYFPNTSDARLCYIRYTLSLSLWTLDDKYCTVCMQITNNTINQQTESITNTESPVWVPVPIVVTEEVVFAGGLVPSNFEWLVYWRQEILAQSRSLHVHTHIKHEITNNRTNQIHTCIDFMTTVYVRGISTILYNDTQVVNVGINFSILL